MDTEKKRIIELFSDGEGKECGVTSLYLQFLSKLVSGKEPPTYHLSGDKVSGKFPTYAVLLPSREKPAFISIFGNKRWARHFTDHQGKVVRLDVPHQSGNLLPGEHDRCRGAVLDVGTVGGSEERHDVA